MLEYLQNSKKNNTMNLKNDEGKLNFVINLHHEYARAMSGGIVALQTLAYKIAERGHNVYIFCKPEYPHENIHVIPSKSVYTEGFLEGYEWEPFNYPLNKTISILPQITRGNSFNTIHTARWILYDTMLRYEKAHDDVKKIFEQLKSTSLNDWKTNGAYDFLREQLNQYEYFLTYDQKSFYTLAAGLCGCKSIILNPGPSYEFAPNAYSDSKQYVNEFSPTEYRLENPIQAFGVAYGWDDIGWANKTIDFVPNYLKELEKIDNKTVDGFIKYWENKIFTS